MQFSKNWLKDFIDLDLSTEEICYQLTMAGIEVDNFENVKSAITGNDAIMNKMNNFVSLKKTIKSFLKYIITAIKDPM